MRLRVAVAMPEKGGRPAVVVTEVLRAPRAPDSRRRWFYVVGRVDRVARQTVEGARDHVLGLVGPVADLEPCVLVDAGTPQGIALRRVLRDSWPDRARLHRPHAYERTRLDHAAFSRFLEAYADARVLFRPEVENRRELSRALVLHRGGGVSESGDELASEDEALVTALTLSMMFPTHGPDARPLVPGDDEDAGVG